MKTKESRFQVHDELTAPERSYQDPFHKPELIFALTRFEGMAGFRDTANSAEILRLLDKSQGLIQPVADRPGHDRRYALDAAKVRQLGWAPRHPFLSAPETTVRWYSAHPAWWQPLKSGEFRAYYERQYGRR